MQRLQILTKFIEKGEKRTAVSLLENIYQENECRSYASALEKILLVEASRELNDKIRGFYIDVDKLKADLFSDNPPTREETVDYICSVMYDAACKDRLNAYEKAEEYIRHNLEDNQLTTMAAAEYTGVSQSTLVKLFSRNVGVTPSDYINKLRIQKSLEYLRENLTVEETSLKVGFSSCETYIRAFKKHMGITPGVWKRNNLCL